MKNKNITGALNPSLQEPSTATTDRSAEGGGGHAKRAGSD